MWTSANNEYNFDFLYDQILDGSSHKLCRKNFVVVLFAMGIAEDLVVNITSELKSSDVVRSYS